MNFADTNGGSSHVRGLYKWIKAAGPNSKSKWIISGYLKYPSWIKDDFRVLTCNEDMIKKLLLQIQFNRVLFVLNVEE